MKTFKIIINVIQQTFSAIIEARAEMKKNYYIERSIPYPYY